MHLHAVVRNGRLELTEPAELEEGQRFELTPALALGEDDDDDAPAGRPFVPKDEEEERASVLASYEHSRAEFDAGLGRDAFELIRELRSRRASAK